MKCKRCGSFLKVEDDLVYPCKKCLAAYLDYRLTGLPGGKDFFAHSREEYES